MSRQNVCWMVDGGVQDDVPVCQHFSKDEINNLMNTDHDHRPEVGQISVREFSYLDEHVPLLQVVWWLALAVRCLRRLGDKSVGDVAQTDLGG